MLASFFLSYSLTMTSPCSAVLEVLEHKIQQNYVALKLYQKNAPARAKSAKESFLKYHFEASQVSEDNWLECTGILQRYISAFDDDHLFLNSTPEFSDEQVALMRDQAKRMQIEPAILRELAMSSTERGPLVGLWAADGIEVAIIPESNGRFIGLVVNSQTENWKSGDVVAVFEKLENEWVAIRYRSRDRAPIRSIARIITDNILHMPPEDWGRISPQPQKILGDWQAFSPRKVRFSWLKDDLAYFAIPSFSPAIINESLASIVSQNKERLKQANLMVIDLRGNNGGSSSTIGPLDPFIMTRDLMGTDDEHSPVLLSSPDTIAYYQRIVSNLPQGLERQVFSDTLHRLETNKGRIVPLLTEQAHISIYNDPRVPEKVFEGPKHVAFIVDSDTVSAGEAVLLRAKRSKRVTSFGVNTRGSIDYQNVSVIKIGEGALSFYLGYPVMADNDKLPIGGNNQNGVAVDVLLQNGEDTWLEQILAYYGYQ